MTSSVPERWLVSVNNEQSELEFTTHCLSFPVLDCCCFKHYHNIISHNLLYGYRKHLLWRLRCNLCGSKYVGNVLNYLQLECLQNDDEYWRITSKLIVDGEYTILNSKAIRKALKMLLLLHWLFSMFTYNYKFRWMLPKSLHTHELQQIYLLDVWMNCLRVLASSIRFIYSVCQQSVTVIDIMPGHPLVVVDVGSEVVAIQS